MIAASVRYSRILILQEKYNEAENFITSDSGVSVIMLF